MKISIVLTGRQYHLAQSIPDIVELSDGATVAEAIHIVQEALEEEDSLPPSCLVTVSGKHLGTLASHENVSLCEEDEVMLIAPVAGG